MPRLCESLRFPTSTHRSHAWHTRCAKRCAAQAGAGYREIITQTQRSPQYGQRIALQANSKEQTKTPGPSKSRYSPSVACSPLISISPATRQSALSTDPSRKVNAFQPWPLLTIIESSNTIVVPLRPRATPSQIAADQESPPAGVVSIRRIAVAILAHCGISP